jgi:spermidine synthase
MMIPGPILLALFAVSGMCGLVYEVVWTRWLGLVTGSFAHATAVAIAVFMGGMALGYIAGGRLAARLSPRRALLLYASLEAGIAALGALSPLLFRASSPVYLALAAHLPFYAIRITVAGCLLFPPAVLMGATLPAILPAAGSGRLAGLYAANTLGAAVGPLVAAFILMPRVGMTLTALTAAALNAGVSACAFLLARRTPAGEEEAGKEPTGGGEGWAIPALAAACGLLALAWETALARLMILLVTGVSVYGLAVTLSSFLAGMSAGAGAAGAVLRRWGRAIPGGALAAVAAALVFPWVASLSLPLWDRIPPLLFRFWSSNPPLWAWQSFNYGAAFLVGLGVAGAFGFALPSLAPRANPRQAGLLFGANTLGAVVGAPLAGFVLMPLLGVDRTISLLGVLSLLTGAAAAFISLPRYRLPILAGVLFCHFLPFLVPGLDRRIENAGMHMRTFRFDGMDIMDAMEEAGAIIFQEDGSTARVAVRSTRKVMVLAINGKSDSGTSIMDMLTMTLGAHIAALSRGAPGECLVIGLGAGITAGSLLRYPENAVTAVEIEPAVVRAASRFSGVTYDALRDPRLRVVLDDARHFLAVTPLRYDIIVSEPSNLYVSGMANLFTAEFYRLARSRLNPGGVFCQWVHFYEVSPEDCRRAVRTFASAFPQVTLWYLTGGDFFLVGSDFPQALDLGRLRAAYGDWRIADDLKRIGVLTPAAFASFMLMGPADAVAFGGTGNLVTDDLPVPEFTSPYRMNDLNSPTDNLAVLQSFPVRDPVPLAGGSVEDRMDLAGRYRDAGALRRSLVEFRAAARARPSPREAWLGMAQVLRLLGDDAGARGAVSRGLARSPGHLPLVALSGELGGGAQRDPFTDPPAGKEAQGGGH